MTIPIENMVPGAIYPVGYNLRKKGNYKEIFDLICAIHKSGAFHYVRETETVPLVKVKDKEFPVSSTIDKKLGIEIFRAGDEKRGIVMILPQDFMSSSL